MLDDVDENMSNKFKKHDLIGVPYQIIIGSKSEQNKFEFKELNLDSKMLSLENIKSQLKIKLFTKAERLISLRNLRPKKKEGFLKVISIFSFLGIMIGVAILIIVMSVMNGFKTDLTKKILGLNPHIVIQPNGYKIEDQFISLLKSKIKDIQISKTYSEGVVIGNENAKGVIIKGINYKNEDSLKFLKQNISSGNLNKFEIGTALVGAELAFNLELKVGDKINLMSSAFVGTPLEESLNKTVTKLSEFLILDFMNLTKILFI